MDGVENKKKKCATAAMFIILLGPCSGIKENRISFRSRHGQERYRTSTSEGSEKAVLSAKDNFIFKKVLLLSLNAGSGDRSRVRHVAFHSCPTTDSKKIYQVKT